MKRLIACFIIMAMTHWSAFASENLDELEARVSRKSANTFYTGEDGVTYVRQPQTVIYVDTNTGHEVMIWSQTPDLDTMRDSTEYGWQPWSADGARIAFTQLSQAGCYSLSTGAPWYIAHSDGSNWRAACESVNRTDIRRPYFDWSPIFPDVAYTVGYNGNGVSSKDQNAIYREDISDSSVVPTSIVDMIGGDTTTLRTGGNKSAISGDGLLYLASSWAEAEPFYIAQIEPSGSRTLKNTYNQPALDDYWANTPSSGQGDWHDEGLVGNASQGYWIYLLHTAGDWWRMRPWGTDNGTPDHTVDESSPYDWWEGTAAQKEIQIVNGSAGTLPDFVGDYWSHGVPDRWGSHVAFSDTEGVNTAPGVFDVDNATQTGYFLGALGAQYHAYTGWTNYAASTCKGSEATNTSICATKYNSLDNGDQIPVASLHSNTINDFTSPGQSPDGTKIAAKSDWLQPTSGSADLFITVPYYPYPPEVTATEATGGTVTVTFDWRLDQVSPRGYTTRGWPNESSDDPPPPRETEKCRLWRSPDKSTWTPLTTTDADIFTRYDFSDGTWDGDAYWTITDTPGDGTWYYAVTSIEWSGLEGKALSNIFAITVSSGSGSGAQDTAYPADPGKTTNPQTSGFYTSYVAANAPKLTRYYNIYAEDGSAASISQVNRIASITKEWCSGGSCSWVDWLGNTDGSTQYTITAVDTQGNESTALSISATHQKAPATAEGQYTLEWDEPTDITAPTTTISTAPYTVYADSFYAAGTASDDVGVSGVKCRVGSAPDAGNGTLCSGTTTWSCSGMDGLSIGANNVHCAAYDAAGNYGDAASPLVVTYTLPSTNSGVTITGNSGGRSIVQNSGGITIRGQ